MTYENQRYELTVTFETNRPATKRELTEIVGDIKNTLADDFGEDAWGGYDGVTLSNVEATKPRVVV